MDAQPDWLLSVQDRSGSKSHFSEVNTLMKTNVMYGPQRFTYQHERLLAGPYIDPGAASGSKHRNKDTVNFTLS